MNPIRLLSTRIPQALLVAALGSVALVGCKKKEEAAPAPPPAASEPAPTPAPDPAPAPAPTASVASIDLGSAVGADMKLTATAASFGPKDKIIASVATGTSDPAATVPAKLGAKWSYEDGQVVHEETKDLNLTGSGVNNFEISKPSGWPKGKYKVEISLDGNVVQTRDFEVK